MKVMPTSWNLKPLLLGDNDPKIETKRKELAHASYNFINKWKDRADYLTDPFVLKEALDEYENWSKLYDSGGDEGYYFWLRTQQDQLSPKLKAKYNQIHEQIIKIQNDMQFFQLKIAKISPQFQKKFLTNPELKKYTHFLEKLFKEAQYLLSEPEEKILNLKSQTSYSNWVKLTSSFLAKEERKVADENGKKKNKTFSEIISLCDNPKKRIRDGAAQALNDILNKNVDIAEVEMNSVLANKKVDDILRKIPRPDLTRHLSDDIETEVVDILVEAVAKKFEIAQKYYQLKAKLFKVKKLQYHERNLTYGELDKKYPYEKSQQLVLKVMQKLDPQFASIFESFIKNNQIDVYPQKGKKGGAFCAHSLITQPTYILLNHTNKLHDVLTLAHELGHGINNELIRDKQHTLNFGTPTSTAEVSSTFMEDFVLQEIMQEADDELRLSLMMMKLNDDISTIFRQTAFYKFETEMHQQFREKGYLSKEEIGQIFQKHMKSYMGSAVEQSSGSQNWWVYVSHFRAFFYVYSYASGLLISKSLQNFVKRDSQYIEKVKEFLSAGLSDSPKNIFSKLGIDITDKKFWDQGLDEVESLLNDTKKLAQKLHKI